MLALDAERRKKGRTSEKAKRRKIGEKSRVVVVVAAARTSRGKESRES